MSDADGLSLLVEFTAPEPEPEPALAPPAAEDEVRAAQALPPQARRGAAAPSPALPSSRACITAPLLSQPLFFRHA